MPSPPEDQRIHEVARRPGGWTLRVGGECRPTFLSDAEAGIPPAAGDVLHTHPDGSREVVRPMPGTAVRDRGSGSA
jgi:hypothetical protein